MGNRRRADHVRGAHRVREERAGRGARRRRPRPGGARREHTGAERVGHRRRPRRGTRSALAVALRTAVVFLSVGTVAGAVAVGVAYLRTPGPADLKPQAAAELKGTSITYADGGEAVNVGELHRIPVEREAIPETVVDGVLAAEQRDFYSEPGVSPAGMARALLSGGTAGGGSTITQQMARNYYDVLSQERTLTRKFKEILIAVKVARSMPRDEVLTTYLNTIYFGRNAYGVQAAAQAYFGKDAEELDRAEGAFIGAVIQQPGNFENYGADREADRVLEKRWRYVVDGMAAMHEDDPDRGLSAAEAERLEFPEVRDYRPEDRLTGYRGYIKAAVQRELRERYGMSDAEIAGGGYVVRTSLDRRLMEAADAAAEEGIAGAPEGTRAGLVAIDSATGEIVAFNGGANFVEETDPSLTDRTQAGPAFKPYVLAAAAEQGEDVFGLMAEARAADIEALHAADGSSEGVPADALADRGPGIGTGTGGLLHRDPDADDALFVGLTDEIGPEAVTETAAAAGIAPEQFETAAVENSIAVGTFQVNALDQARGYATLAADGVHRPAHMVTEVATGDGEVRMPLDADEVADGAAAVDPAAARATVHAMTEATARAPGLIEGRAAAHDVAAVSGGYGTGEGSAWFVGATPSYSVAVDVFRPDGGTVAAEGRSGTEAAAHTWNAFTDDLLKDVEPQRFPAAPTDR
ncbi:transglycosylase domain-containing protein [Nocardiopsis suaedae]|uniref:Transglycosylase domain-containing protein n=1 Tax=Nocardiopsis suaedae TaxID=3018444 RepID=A0ABT4TFD3_9ACTN|nr:transglycosylase domain-containing protein [Nocardiopsis suaedae]MDA2803370.1 transglycosylase domain-containing protein [Nocardiopsis suaedae]